MDHKYRPQDPATARNPKRKAELEAKMKKYEEGKDAGSKSSLYEEGSVHAGMIAEALKKLPKKTGTLYRGARMTPADFAKAYAPGQVITCEAFVSQSTSKDTARDFASGKTGQPKDDATVSVFSIAKITDARDIMALSVVGDAEQELLLLPGAKLVVEKIEDDTDQQPGNPTATDWKIVHLKQIE
jgi:hypothetical protein